MYIVDKLDAGDVILKKEIDILDSDTTGSLHDKLADLGAEALIESLDIIQNEKVEVETQDENLVTFTKPIKKNECQINWQDTSKNIYNFVRGLNPFPTAYTMYEGKRFKIYKVEILDEEITGDMGEIVKFLKKKGPVIKTSDGCVVLLELKPENKGKISGNDIVNGKMIKRGKKLN